MGNGEVFPLVFGGFGSTTVGVRGRGGWELGGRRGGDAAFLVFHSLPCSLFIFFIFILRF